MKQKQKTCTINIETIVQKGINAKAHVTSVVFFYFSSNYCNGCNAVFYDVSGNELGNEECGKI
jgi:hypothetical protein